MTPVLGRRKRLPREQRQRLILEEAVRFFSEVGFEGQTRALAERLGVTQPLLYRYFPDKETLIEKVFDEVYVKRWDPAWEDLLTDRSRPLLDRVITFTKEYCHTISQPELVRIFMFAGLKGERINEAYIDLIREKALAPICIELRHELGLPPPEVDPLDEMEIHVVWGLVGSVFHIAMRKWIYNVDVPEDTDKLVESTVRAFMQGIGPALLDLAADRAPAPRAARA